MDIPDAFFAFSKLLNYIDLKRAKIVSFLVFLCVWTYFRHYLNFVMLWSVYSEFSLMPETSKRWAPEDGVWMVWWMKWQVFAPLVLLQALNLFWYYLILRVLYMCVVSSSTRLDALCSLFTIGPSQSAMQTTCVRMTKAMMNQTRRNRYPDTPI